MTNATGFYGNKQYYRSYLHKFWTFTKKLSSGMACTTTTIYASLENCCFLDGTISQFAEHKKINKLLTMKIKKDIV